VAGPDFSKLTPEQQRELARMVLAAQRASEPRPFYTGMGEKTADGKNTGRPKQYPPDHPRHHAVYVHPQTGLEYRCQDKLCLAGKTDENWRMWMLLTGRGFGKTEAGSNWIVDQAIKNPGTTWGVAAPVESDLFKTCFNGDSGILAQLRDDEKEDYNMNRHTVRLTNGSEIRGFTVDNPQRIRGANLYGLWIDEIAASIRGEEFLMETALPAVRKGKARIVFTTTPKPTPLMRKLAAGVFGTLHLTRGVMYENPALSEEAIETLRRVYLGKRAGRQELEGELLDEFEGALFSRQDLDDYRIIAGMQVPNYSNIVVGFDPAMKSGEESDESGIVVAASAEMDDGFEHAFILDDQSMKGSPAEVAKRVSIAAQVWGASCVYYEPNQGGDWIKDTLRSIDPLLPLREAHSSVGKIMRAQPVSALCEAGRIHMVGVFPELEEELCIMRPNVKSKGGDDDRSDAMIHAIFGLKLISSGSYILAYGQYTCTNCEKIYPRMRQSCPHCGMVREVRMEEPERPPRGSWADAYMDTCPKCRSRYPKNSTCQKCVGSPMAYMRQIGAFSGMAGKDGGPGYSDRNWFKGRKI
jgi:phage terminase large subunit-like protein